MRYVTIYNFEELSKKAKKNAIENVRKSRECDQIPWAEENAESIKAIAKAMNCDYKIDNYNRVYFAFNNDYAENILVMEGSRAYAYIWNNWIEPNLKAKYLKWSDIKNRAMYAKLIKVFDCPFTGYCADRILYDEWEYFKKNPTNVLGFIGYIECAIEKFLDDEDEYFYSDEYIKDIIESEDLKFTEEGKIF